MSYVVTTCENPIFLMLQNSTSRILLTNTRKMVIVSMEERASRETKKENTKIIRETNIQCRKFEVGGGGRASYKVVAQLFFSMSRVANPLTIGIKE